MDTCIVESGFLKKKVCGKAAVTRCINCEGALCAEHAVPEVSASGARTGKFLCQECKAALKDHEKRLASVEAKPAAPKPAAPKPAAPPPAAPPPAAAQKPAAPAAKAAPAPAEKEAPAEKKEGFSTLEFTPSSDKKDEPK